MCTPISWQRWVVVFILLLGGVLGCAVAPDASEGDVLRLRFPDQAGEAFVAIEDGFALASTSDAMADVEASLGRRGGLRAALPESGEGELRFQLPGGFEVRVRERGAEGEGAIVERAVAYAREGGT